MARVKTQVQLDERLLERLGLRASATGRDRDQPSTTTATSPVSPQRSTTIPPATSVRTHRRSSPTSTTSPSDS